MKQALLAILALFSVATMTFAGGEKKVTVALNWVPEPEFGGVYEAQRGGAFGRQGIAATIQPGGAGAPTWQLVSSGKVPFAIASADEIVIARAQGADVVGIFTTYQTCPQGIMVHASRNFKAIDAVFQNSGTIAMEPGLPYAKFLQQKYGFDKIKRVSYDGGIANFLADTNFSQQCFITSEPLAAKKAGGDPQVFLISDAGYNPYTGVVITTSAMLRDNPDVVGAVSVALVEGWSAYMKDPKLTNDMMGKLNKSMDAETFAAAADAQKPLIEGDDTKAHRLGWMSTDRWNQLCKQLAELKVVDKTIPADECFKNVAGSTLR